MHKSVKEPDVFGMHPYPHEEQTPGDKSKARQKVCHLCGKALIRLFLTGPFEPQDAGHENHAYRKHLPKIDVNHVEEPLVVPANHESNDEASQVAKIQRREPRKQSSRFLPDGGRVENYEAEEKACREKRGAFRDDFDREFPV
ncbi:hypothetical protein SBDP1_300012 [Syntrophobacter sp. SbD1]|nr:hypothetical protein SBDP1_300012 [Syntrophobacter sp. SbD1]